MKIYFLFAILFCSIPAKAQVGENFKNDFFEFFEVGGDVLTAPVYFDKKDWIHFAGTITATAGAYFIDGDIRDFGRRNRSIFNKNLFNVDKYYYLEFASVSIAALYGYGLFAEDDDIRKLGFDLGSAVFYSSLLTVAIKSITGRTRSTLDAPNNFFRPFQVSMDNSSFPSAHTSLAFSFSTVMAHHADNFFWKAGWYTAAGLVAAARIYNDKHWLSDVLLGAALGHFVAEYVVHRNDEENGKENLSFHFNLNSAAIVISF